MSRILIILLFAVFGYSQEQIEGRWHLVGYEDNVMYQFVDTDYSEEAGLKYTIYSTDGYFDDLDGENTGGTPHPYSIDEDIITIDYHFGNVIDYQMIFRCEGQVVDFYIENESDFTLFRELYDYNDCLNMPNECFNLSEIDFGMCDMYLGVGWDGYQCDYFSGCDWVGSDGIDYSEHFYDSWQDCEESCQCEDGEVNNDNPCNPIECWDGQWVEIIIDCAEDMGFPCDGGLYIPAEAGECCSECIEFGDINYDQSLNILDVIQLVNMILIQDYSNIADINFDSILNVLDVITMIDLILE
jgi:hypothetical protein